MWKMLAALTRFILAAAVLAVRNPDPEKVSAYECGFNAFDDARMKFYVWFYLVSILFIIFDLDDTLYPSSNGLMGEVGRRIQTWLCENMELTWEDAVALRAAIDEDKGEVTADVVSAKPLTKTQVTKLAKTLKERVGKDVKISATVDESLIGGLIVKVGSKMIDTSIASKLNSLQNAMKEVG